MHDRVYGVLKFYCYKNEKKSDCEDHISRLKLSKNTKNIKEDKQEIHRPRAVGSLILFWIFLCFQFYETRASILKWKKYYFSIFFLILFVCRTCTNMHSINIYFNSGCDPFFNWLNNCHTPRLIYFPRLIYSHQVYKKCIKWYQKALTVSL